MNKIYIVAIADSSDNRKVVEYRFRRLDMLKLAVSLLLALGESFLVRYEQEY